MAGCKMIVGIKNPRKLNDEEIRRYAKKYHVPPDEIYKIDTALYRAEFSKIRSVNPARYKDFFQPLQVKGFDSGGRISLFLINCNVGGFPNLDWNFRGSFDVYPPVQNGIKMVDTLLRINDDLKFYSGLNANTNKAQENAYVLVVFWSRYMNRQSRKLISIIQKYREKYSDKKIHVFFVNVDNLY